MAAAELTILIKARDEASRALDGIRGKAGKLGGALAKLGKVADAAAGRKASDCCTLILELHGEDKAVGVKIPDKDGGDDRFVGVIMPVDISS